MTRASDEHIHRATSPDGTRIAGRVAGQGPPLVLVHGALFCGETLWTALLPHLTDRFTCFMPSARGRGLSADSADQSLRRSFEDMSAFVDSIGQPVSLLGTSSGGAVALGVAAEAEAVESVVVHEPTVFELMDDDLLARMTETSTSIADEVAGGRPAEAARHFMALVYNDDELTAAVDRGRHQDAAPNMASDLAILANLATEGPPGLTDPTRLASIAAPVLLTQGEDTTLDWFVRSTSHVAEHVPDCRTHVIPDIGHGVVSLAPDALAAEAIRFLQRQQQPA